MLLQDPADDVFSEHMVAADMLDFLEAFFEGEGQGMEGGRRDGKFFEVEKGEREGGRRDGKLI